MKYVLTETLNLADGSLLSWFRTEHPCDLRSWPVQGWYSSEQRKTRKMWKYNTNRWTVANDDRNSGLRKLQLQWWCPVPYHDWPRIVWARHLCADVLILPSVFQTDNYWWFGWFLIARYIICLIICNQCKLIVIDICVKQREMAVWLSCLPSLSLWSKMSLYLNRKDACSTDNRVAHPFKFIREEQREKISLLFQPLEESLGLNGAASNWIYSWWKWIQERTVCDHLWHLCSRP